MLNVYDVHTEHSMIYTYQFWKEMRIKMKNLCDKSENIWKEN